MFPHEKVRMHWPKAVGSQNGLCCGGAGRERPTQGGGTIRSGCVQHWSVGWLVGCGEINLPLNIYLPDFLWVFQKKD